MWREIAIRKISNGFCFASDVSNLQWPSLLIKIWFSGPQPAPVVAVQLQIMNLPPGRRWWLILAENKKRKQEDTRAQGRATDRKSDKVVIIITDGII